LGFALNRRLMFVGLVAQASTAMLVWFGNGLNPWWPLLWLAPLAVLVFALRSSWQSAALVSGRRGWPDASICGITFGRSRHRFQSG
jgi:apolipoprotein N-acyltransferase